eukprot:TRINITY_DN3569_c0_g1_i1.p2 TRINITY_DN3569_c0_g1~~TRINITY_DN3569_c0_g1_i1.p2  ORF type:complete len:187 (+),score=43.16 TRINITY_DN3569_c0_g1_i1:211-771(+)
MENLVYKSASVKVRNMIQSDCNEGKLAPWNLFDIEQTKDDPWMSCSGCKRQAILEKVTKEGCNINWVVGNADVHPGVHKDNPNKIYNNPSENYAQKEDFRCKPDYTPTNIGSKNQAQTKNKFKTILGFKQDINDHCNPIHLAKNYNTPAGWDDGDNYHGSDCINAGYHRLRLNSDPKHKCDGNGPR